MTKVLIDHHFTLVDRTKYIGNDESMYLLFDSFSHYKHTQKNIARLIFRI